MKDSTYIAIDLKSFYASAECVDRGLDPLTANLVVADLSRTEKTICLAVSPALKAYGIPGRARLFEVVQKVKEVNARRLTNAQNRVFQGSSCDANELQSNKNLRLDYIIAPPRMAHYIKMSTKIYQLYLKYIAPEDIHVYSIDEVFIDATKYLKTHNLTPRELAMKMILDVLQTTGITATAGIGPNLYLCKIAMDIYAKHIPADKNGVRIAELDEMTYRKVLWSHRPLTDFWRVGRGYAAKLEKNGLYTMGDIARCSVGKPTDFYNESMLYKMFGINAELLIDHAWGWEPCTIADIKAYKPSSNSIGSGQVLQSPYNFQKAKLVVHEMTELLVLDLVSKNLVANQFVLTIGYDIDNLTDAKGQYQGDVTTDRYGRKVPKSAHRTVNLDRQTSSTILIWKAVSDLFDRLVDQNLLVRRINISAANVVCEADAEKNTAPEQLNLFDIPVEKEQESVDLKREKNIQKTMLDIKNKFGKNAILKGLNLEEGATTISRNEQIGGHKA